MFVGITNTPRDYAWGSDGAISELLGQPASGRAEAELWLGAHEGSPSRVEGTTQTLIDVVGGRLPFLLKVLAAKSSLSLQAHPTMEQAAAGFARENALGIPLDAPDRNYRDAFHKPELIYALEDGFQALCGFRSADDIRATFQTLLPESRGLLDRLAGDDAIRDVFRWLITRGEGVDDLVAAVVRAAGTRTDLGTVGFLSRSFPGDPGIVISLMLNEVTLAKGEVLYLPAGNIHAYLRGIGIELMASSDNVLRGGLTPKHIDVPELLSVLDFRPVPVPYLEAEHPEPGVAVFRPDVPDFVLVVIEDGGSVALDGPAIALCTAGSLTVAGAHSRSELPRGGALYLTADEGTVSFAGSGTVFVATTG